MKNNFLIINRKLLLVFVLSISTLGLTQSNLHAQGFATPSETLSEAMQRQSWRLEKSEKSVTIKNLSSGGLNVTKINKNSFDIGRRFALAVFNIGDLRINELSYQNMLTDLTELIDNFEGKTEAVQLQKILTGMTKRTFDDRQIKMDIEKIAKNYLTKQSETQKWYFNSGSNVIKLIFASYLGNDNELKKTLSELQSLIKIAPTETPNEIIQPMENLVRYVTQPNFSDNDYQAIYERAVGITQLFVA